VCVIKTLNNPINKKFKNPCNLMIYRDLRFKDVVPPGIEQIRAQG
jgi:hypothetical protein